MLSFFLICSHMHLALVSSYTPGLSSLAYGSYTSYIVFRKFVIWRFNQLEFTWVCFTSCFCNFRIRTAFFLLLKLMLFQLHAETLWNPCHIFCKKTSFYHQIFLESLNDKQFCKYTQYYYTSGRHLCLNHSVLAFIYLKTRVLPFHLFHLFSPQGKYFLGGTLWPLRRSNRNDDSEFSLSCYSLTN